MEGKKFRFYSYRHGAVCEATLTDEQYQELVDEYNKDVRIQKMVGIDDVNEYITAVLSFNL